MHSNAKLESIAKVVLSKAEKGAGLKQVTFPFQRYPSRYELHAGIITPVIILPIVDLWVYALPFDWYADRHRCSECGGYVQTASKKNPKSQRRHN